MKLSVVIPAYNEEKLLPECLRTLTASLRSACSGPWEWEIIVCDNNSTDQTATVARSGGAQVIFEPINQIGRARNTGASMATGDWLLFLDADSVVSSSLISELLQACESGEVIGGGACLTPMGEWSGKLVVPMTIWNIVSRVGRLAAGSFLYCRSDAFHRVGGFSTEHFAGEELNLSIKLKRAAREEGSTFKILTRARLQTSARKAGLYSNTELIRTFFSILFRFRGTTGKRAACYFWYDGRR